MVMAASLIGEDPATAHQHALAASRRGGRIGVVRETLAITAYATGDYALALRELRTYRRITGRDDQLPMMVDSERGLGRADRALELGRSVPRDSLPVPVQVELAIAMSGARLDLGQVDRALAELEIRNSIPRPPSAGARVSSTPTRPSSRTSGAPTRPSAGTATRTRRSPHSPRVMTKKM